MTHCYVKINPLMIQTVNQLHLFWKRPEKGTFSYHLQRCADTCCTHARGTVRTLTLSHTQRVGALITWREEETTEHSEQSRRREKSSRGKIRIRSDFWDYFFCWSGSIVRSVSAICFCWNVWRSTARWVKLLKFHGRCAAATEWSQTFVVSRCVRTNLGLLFCNLKSNMSTNCSLYEWNKWPVTSFSQPNLSA